MIAALFSLPRRLATWVTGGTEAETARDGSSFAKAFVIPFDSQMLCVRFEYAYIAEHYPGYQRTTQSLVEKGRHAYDVLHLRHPDGDEKKVYFDITASFRR